MNTFHGYGGSPCKQNDMFMMLLMMMCMPGSGQGNDMFTMLMLMSMMGGSGAGSPMGMGMASAPM